MSIPPKPGESQALPCSVTAAPPAGRQSSLPQVGTGQAQEPFQLPALPPEALLIPRTAPDKGLSRKTGNLCQQKPSPARKGGVPLVCNTSPAQAGMFSLSPDAEWSRRGLCWEPALPSSSFLFSPSNRRDSFSPLKEPGSAQPCSQCQPLPLLSRSRNKS